MLIVVTGAGGFIGSYLRSWFTADGHEVIAAARSGSSHAGLIPFEPGSAAFIAALGRQPDVLVHAAGSSQVAESFADPSRDFRDNTTLYLDVLEAVRHHAPACRVVLLSSAAVYGNPPAQPAGEATALAPISPYGYHKRMAEQLGQMYHALFGLRTCAVRIFSAYGRGLRRQVVYDAIRLLQNSRPDHPAVFRGTGSEARDFIHVEDIARGVQAVINGGEWTGEAYNLASGVSTTIADLTTLVRSMLGSSATAAFDNMPSRGYPLVWQADITRIRQLGFAPAWTLDRGIAEMVSHWAEDHRPPA
jgi:UDP-glucose 4-epimerase